MLNGEGCRIFSAQVRVPVLCNGDTNGDGQVNVTDLIAVVFNWGDCGGCCLSDLDLNGVVDVADLVTLIPWAGGRAQGLDVSADHPPGQTGGRSIYRRARSAWSGR